MNTPSDTGTPVGNRGLPSGAPDWELIPFEVGCSRCGHDLRGLIEPRCPACGLEFDWAQAVPIEALTCLHCGYHLYGLGETRCPECGRAFTWNEVLDDYRRRKPLFEYHWRTRPARSFVKSWWLAMRPWKLWEVIDIHDPPSKGGLFLLLLIAATLYVLAPVTLAHLGGWVIKAVEQLAALGLQGRYWAGGQSRLVYRTYLVPWGVSLSAAAGYWLLTIVPLTCWSAGTLGALLLLRQSMSLCKVRNSHVVRAWAYALLPALSGSVLFCLFALLWDASVIWLRADQNWVFRMDLLLMYDFVLLLVAWTLLSLGLAYQRYIKMRHAWWVALTSLAIGSFLAVIAVIQVRLLLT